MGITNFLKRLFTVGGWKRQKAKTVSNTKNYTVVGSEIKTKTEKKVSEAYSEKESFGIERKYSKNISMKSLYEEKISKFYYKEPDLNSDIESVRLYLQQFNTGWGGGLYSLLFYHFKIRYKSKSGILLLYADGRCIMTSENMTLVEFSQKVKEYIFEKLDNFTSLSEKDKTVHLLKHLGIKKIDFSSKRYSWISRPDFWILSETVDFEAVNSIILSVISYRDMYLLTKYLPYMIFAVLGSYEVFRRRASPYSVAYSSGNFGVFDDLKYYCKFVPEKLIVKKFLKSNYDENREFPYWYDKNQKIIMIYKEYNIYESAVIF